MNRYGFVFKLPHEVARMFTVKKDVNRHASVVRAQALHTMAKLRVVIRRL
jgi:hypothetical protein